MKKIKPELIVKQPETFEELVKASNLPNFSIFIVRFWVHEGTPKRTFIHDHLYFKFGHTYINRDNFEGNKEDIYYCVDNRMGVINNIRNVKNEKNN